MNESAFKPITKYRALEDTLAQMKADKILRSPNVHLAAVLGYGGQRPDNRFRDTLDPQSYEKRFNDKEWELITDELYRIDPKYAQLFFNTYLSHLYGFNVIDEAMVQPSGKSTIEEVCHLSKRVVIETSDIMRVEIELLQDGDVSHDDMEKICKEADEAILALKAYKERVMSAVSKEEE